MGETERNIGNKIFFSFFLTKSYGTEQCNELSDIK